MHQNCSESESYKKIVKNTAAFGGSQIVQMIITLFRAKIVAVLLGSLGMGINALILSALSIVQEVSSVGIFQSGIREMAALEQIGDKVKIAKFRAIFLKISLLCGILGMVLFILLSPWLSLISFHNYDYTYWFIGASITILFMALQNGRSAIMQATQNLGLMARASMVGAVVGLPLIAVLFYFFRLHGIVPAIITVYLVFYIVFRRFEKKIIFIGTPSYTNEELINQSKPILKVGALLMLSFTLIAAFTFLLNVFISNLSSVDNVGYYQAAVSICMQAMVIVNAILASDYFPRLSSIHNDPQRMKIMINQQSEIMLYVIAPISVVLIAVAPFIVTLLLSKKFQIIVPLIQTMSISLVFRVVWLILSYIILAKGDRRTYLIYDALIGNGFNFILNIIAFYFFGLNGLRLSYIVGAVFMVILLAIVVRTKYKFFFTVDVVIKFLMVIGITILAALASHFLSGVLYYSTLSILVCFIGAYSFIQLNNKIGLVATLKK